MIKIHSNQWTPRHPLNVKVGYPVLLFARSGESKDRPAIERNFDMEGPCPVMSLLHKILIGITRPNGVIIRYATSSPIGAYASPAKSCACVGHELIFGSHNDPGGTPTWLRMKVKIKTTIMSPEEISGIATNQFDELVIRPEPVNLFRLEKYPSLDLYPAAKHTAKIKIKAYARRDKLTDTGNAVYRE